MSLRISSLSLCLLLIAAVGGEAAAATLDFHAAIRPRSNVVRLGDMATITAASPAQQRDLQLLPLATAPPAGYVATLQRAEILDAMRARGVNVGQLRLLGATQVVIDARLDEPPQPQLPPAVAAPPARAEVITPSPVAPLPSDAPRFVDVRKLRNDLEARVLAYLQAASGQPEGWEVQFRLKAAELRTLEAATSPLTITGGGPPWTGHQRLIAKYRTVRGEAEFPFTVQASFAPKIVFLRRDLPRGTLITAADLQLMRDEKLAKSSLHVMDPALAIGREATQRLSAGRPLLSNQFRKPLLVTRGQRVRVTAETGGIRVTMAATAKEEGGEGDVVLIEYPDTKQQLRARVVGSGELAVFAGGADASVKPAPPARLGLPPGDRPLPGPARSSGEHESIAREGRGWSRR